MIRRLALAAALAWALAAPVAAEPGLPPPDAVEQALEAHPSVTAARARLDVARARAEALRRGTHEFSVQGGYTRRDVRGEAGFNEYDVQLSRPVRLPGKARLDAAIGAHGIEVAQNVAEDARHEAALLLAGHWFDWLAASAQARVDRAAVANYEAALAAVERRRALREGAALEVDQARAALADAQRALALSSGMARLARTRLEAQFPALALPAEAPELPPPDLAEARLARLGELVVANSHMLAAARAESARTAALASRARAERVADPTVGLRLFSEFGGIERGAGLVVSVPLGGGHRRALADEASAGASAARADEARARLEVAETAAADMAEVRLRITSWQRARDSVTARQAALARLRRGHRLGEIDLAELLLGERLVHDALRSEADARAGAMRAITRLRIYAHDLWLAD